VVVPSGAFSRSEINTALKDHAPKKQEPIPKGVTREEHKNGVVRSASAKEGEQWEKNRMDAPAPRLPVDRGGTEALLIVLVAGFTFMGLLVRVAPIAGKLVGLDLKMNARDAPSKAFSKPSRSSKRVQDVRAELHKVHQEKRRKDLELFQMRAEQDELASKVAEMRAKMLELKKEPNAKAQPDAKPTENMNALMTSELSLMDALIHMSDSEDDEEPETDEVGL